MRPFPRIKQRNTFNLPLRSNIISTIYNGNDKRVADIFYEVINKLPNTYLLLIGEKNKDALLQAKSLNLLNHVIETGFVKDEDLPKYISCADVCFQILNNNLFDKSRYPLKISNYLSVGRATVINDVGDIAELFKESEIGFLAKSDFDKKEFAEKIVRILKNRHYREKCEKNARNLMVEKYDWKTTIGKNIETLMEFTFKNEQ